MQGNVNDLAINLGIQTQKPELCLAAVYSPVLDFPLLQGYFKAIYFDSTLYVKGKSKFMLQSKKFLHS